jgi:hypothetical protein
MSLLGWYGFLLHLKYEVEKFFHGKLREHMKVVAV